MSLPTLRPVFSPFLCSPLFYKPNCFQLSISTQVWSGSLSLLSVLLLAGMGFRCRGLASCRPVLSMIRPPYSCQYMVNILPIYLSHLVQAEQFSVVNCVHVGVWMGRLRWSWRGGRRFLCRCTWLPPLAALIRRTERVYAPAEC